MEVLNLFGLDVFKEQQAVRKDDQIIRNFSLLPLPVGNSVEFSFGHSSGSLKDAADVLKLNNDKHESIQLKSECANSPAAVKNMLQLFIDVSFAEEFVKVVSNVANMSTMHVVDITGQPSVSALTNVLSLQLLKLCFFDTTRDNINTITQLRSLLRHSQQYLRTLHRLGHLLKQYMHLLCGIILIVGQITSLYSTFA